METFVTHTLTDAPSTSSPIDAREAESIAAEIKTVRDRLDEMLAEVQDFLDNHPV